MGGSIICIGWKCSSNGSRRIGEKPAYGLNIPCYDKLLLKQAAEKIMDLKMGEYYHE